MASSVSDIVLRGAHFFRKEGFRNTVFRLYTHLKRCVCFNREIVYWMDLSIWSPATSCLKHGHTILAIHNAAEIPEGLRTRLAEEFPAKIVNRRLRERLQQKATLWCFHDESEVLGYTWTLSGRTLRPYYFPLTARDVHIFDDLIFPPFRGRSLNSILLGHVLEHFKEAGFQRAYVETAEWNIAEQRSLEKTGFGRLGLMRKHRRDVKTISG